MYLVPCMSTDVKNFSDMIVRLLIGHTSVGYSGWSKDAAHRKQAKQQRIFADIWPETGGSLPWRLTAAQREMLDRRTGRIMWPHYVERLHYRGASFWKKPSRMWKCRRKYRLLLYFLPVLLRDQVPAVRNALLLLTWSLRRLDGQVYSYEDATKRMGILPGSRALDKSIVDDIHRDIVCALSLLEGCLPLGYLIPSMHHMVHYAEYAKTHGILRGFWMMSFERLVLFVIYTQLTVTICMFICAGLISTSKAWFTIMLTLKLT